MATEQSATAMEANEDAAEWTGWIAALFGLWVAVSPFVLAGPIGSGNALYSNVISGVVVAALGGFAAWTHRERRHGAAEWSGWVAAIAGLWTLVTPFVLTGAIGAGAALYSNVTAGLVALVLAGFAGYVASGR